MAGGFNLTHAETRCVVAAVLSAFSFGSLDARAQLVGGQVVAGQATISSPSATSTLIQQKSPTTIINWQGFSIPSGSSVTFQQPSASALALNRVTGGSASLIYGSLNANGRVWLINRNGIVLGPSAQVSAAGVLLSTMDIRDQDFLSGNYSFGIPGNADASIVNQGRIVATEGGSVVLAAPRVRNDGLIEADLGTVVLAGAKTLTVDFAGDDLLRFAMPTAAVESATEALVTNTGTLAAPGGRVLLTASAAKGVLDNVINTSGIVEATSVSSVNGKIVLSAAGGGTQVSGTLDASGKGAGETGGAIDVLGDAVTLASGARVDVSGDAGGGAVNVGGTFHGAGPQPNAQTTVVEAGSLIDASALTLGDGGRVAVWSNGSTTFAGTILARGGALGGNGGYVETSGWQHLAVSGTVDARAPLGHVGTWLLDPVVDVTICNTCAVSPGSITPSGADVAVTSGGSIIVQDPVVYSAANQLNLLAQGDVDVNASVQNSGAGAVTLVAGWDGSTGLTGNTVTAATIISAHAYGAGGGSVNIGDGNQVSGIAVGSAGGTTTVAAANLTLQASNLIVNDAYAQLGFNGGGASGDIIVALSGALALNGGNSAAGADEDFAQLGHGGAFSNGSNSGNISVTTGGAVSLNGGTAPDSYAQIGHGGRTSNFFALPGSIAQTGAISVTATDVTVAGGDGTNSYAQIGHGGFQANGVSTVGGGSGTVTFSGDISVAASNTISVTAGAGGSKAYAQIGHGGSAANLDVFAASIDMSGNITITSAALTVAGGGANQSYAQIGHGGEEVDENVSANFSISGQISVTSSAVSLVGGSTNDTYAQIGHGGFFTGVNSTVGGGGGSVTLSGDISVSASGLISLTSPNGGNASYTQIGHGGFGANSSVAAGGIDLSGNITVAAAGLTLAAGGGGIDYAQIGHGGANLNQNASGSGTISGSITVTVGASGMTLAAGGGAPGSSDYAQIGHGDASGSASTSATGDIVVSVAGTTTLSSNFDAAAFIGNKVGGDLNTVTGNLSFISGAIVDSGIFSALQGILAQDVLEGNVLIASSGPASMTIDSGLGYGSIFDLTLLFGGSVTFLDSVQNSGPGAVTVVAGWNGTTGLVPGQPGVFDVSTLLSTANSYGQGGGGVTIGDSTQGFKVVVGSLTGPTTVAGASLTMIGANNSDGLGYAQLGYDSGGGSGNIIVAVTGSITLTGGQGFSPTYAQIGYGGDFQSIGNTGNITISAGGDVTLSAGPGVDAYAQIGHGGDFFNGDNSGAISLTIGGNLTLNGSTDASQGLRYAQIGHGGGQSQGGAAGSIVIIAGGAVTLNGGAGTNDDYAQIGHGGGSSNLSVSNSFGLTGSIDITAASISLNGGSGLGDYAQIGHGGYFAGDISDVGGGSIVYQGDITLNASAALTLVAGGTDSYAQIGNGGNQSNEQAHANTITDAGNIFITIGGGGTDGTLTMLGGTGGNAYAQIGHGGFESSFNAVAAGGIAQTGTISVTINGAASTAAVTGGSNGSFSGNYAQIGHGDPIQTVTGNESGDIALTVGGTTTFSNGAGGAFAFLGNGLPSSGSASGNIVLTSNAITSVGGALENSIASTIGGGTVTFQSLGSGTISLPGSMAYSSVNPLVLSSTTGTIVLGTGITNSANGSVTLSATTVTLGQKIATQGGAITINGNAVLSQSATLDSTNQGAAPGGAPIDVTGRIDDTASGAQSLVLTAGTASVTVGGPIGGLVPLGDLTINAGAITLDGTIVTKGGNITFNGPTSFVNGTNIDTTAGGTAAAGSVSFAQGAAFVVNGQSTFAGTFSFPNGGFSLSGTGDVLIGPGTTVAANGPIAIGSPGSLLRIDGQGAGGQALIINGGSNAVSLFVTLGGTTPLGSLTVTGGSITLGGSATTTGSQTYVGPVTIAANTTLIGNGQTLLFSSAVVGNGTAGLTIDPFSVVQFDGPVGSPSQPLAFFNVTGSSIILNDSVYTTGPQTYAGTLVLDSVGTPNVVYQTNGAPFSESGSTFMGGSPGFGSPPLVSIDTTGNGASPAGSSITFTSPGDINGNAALSFSAGSGGAISVGALGLANVTVVSGASFAFLPPAPPNFTCPICAVPEEPDVTDDSNVQQQTAAHLPLFSLLDIEPPSVTLGLSPPLPIVLTSSGPGSGPDTSGGGDTQMLTSVVDLDLGSQLFTQIVPGSGGSGGSSEPPEALTIIEPIKPATLPVPPPQNAEEPVGGTGSTVYRARGFLPNLPGVPGVDQPALGTGNRGLWFAAPNATP